ncbi:cytochrome P450 CYP5293A1 [Lentithecium fluviatile CBS 122367]|uniref:Cytochrome P450 CYP5293A1 n=1 Tax=Lentithecium fluviatile CBS 122367 TaxID=1168545 RepID=A0A6G1J6Q7_9PLEO|nr:cytochrome P450 CYP5293A1 [Lentithecium fluviatile CBS 122367]
MNSFSAPESYVPDIVGAQMLSLPSEFLSRPSLAIATFVVVLLACLLSLSTKTRKRNGYFKNESGDQLREYGKDTFAMRFTHGQVLSDEGRKLAGEDPYLVRNGPFRELVIFSPAHLQEFLRKDAKGHWKPKNMNAGDWAGRILGQCVGQQNGPKWKTMRSHFDPEFSHLASMGMLPGFSNEIERWVDGLSTNPIGESKMPGGFVQDTVQAGKYLAFRLISMSVYGDAFTEARFARLLELSKVHTQVLITGIIKQKTTSWWYNQLPTQEKRLMSSFQSQWRAFNEQVVKDSREHGISCPAERIYHGVDSGDMSRIEFLQTVDEMLFANIDITGSIIAFIVVNLASNQSFQERLRVEIEKQKQSKSYNYESYITKQDTLLHYLTLESLRVTPAMYFSAPECTSQPKRIDGYLIPPNMPTIIDVRRLNTHPSVWGEGQDAQAFRPERFQTMPPSAYKNALLRFGIGASKCMGKNMADLMIKLSALRVLERYVLVKGDSKDSGLGGYTVSKNGEVEFLPLGDKGGK